MDTISQGAKTIIIPAIGAKGVELIRHYQLHHVKVINATKNNPYQGKVKSTSFWDGNVPDKELYKSSLGTPVLTDLTITGGYFTDPVSGEPIPYPTVTFVTVLITVDQTKNIVRTQIQGMDGAVKEYIGMDDYMITINGIIPGSNNHFPINEVRALHLVNTAPVALPVVSTYLQNLDIDHIVINRFTYNQEEGGYSQQPFTINAYSAKDIDLIVTTGKTGNTVFGPKNQSY